MVANLEVTSAAPHQCVLHRTDEGASDPHIPATDRQSHRSGTHLSKMSARGCLDRVDMWGLTRPSRVQPECLAGTVDSLGPRKDVTGSGFLTLKATLSESET